MQNQLSSSYAEKEEKMDIKLDEITYENELINNYLKMIEDIREMWGKYSY